MRSRHMAFGKGREDLMDRRDALTSDLDQFAQDAAFLESIRPELLNKYPDCWVAVYKKRVVASGPVLRDVVKQLSERGFPRTRVVVDYLTTEHRALIL